MLNVAIVADDEEDLSPRRAAVLCLPKSFRRGLFGVKSVSDVLGAGSFRHAIIPRVHDLHGAFPFHFSISSICLKYLDSGIASTSRSASSPGRGENISQRFCLKLIFSGVKTERRETFTEPKVKVLRNFIESRSAPPSRGENNWIFEVFNFNFSADFRSICLENICRLTHHDLIA